MSNLYIGLMSGTSVDGIDAVLVSFNAQQIKLLASSHTAIPEELQTSLLAFNAPAQDELARYASCDVLFGRLLAQAVNTLLESTAYSAADIMAIGSHGQTVRHYPIGKTPTTLQIGDPNIVAELTGITTVADFRRRDMAAGGQGAPLVPAFHKVLFSAFEDDQVILNIGGIANITSLPTGKNARVSGYDTGPGNCLMDEVALQHLKRPYDRNGEWGASGHVHPGLLDRMLNDAYFAKPAPKSTGRDYFNLGWLDAILKSFPNLAAQDIQATLRELTARTICDAITTSLPDSKRVLVCGGGVHNSVLMQRLDELLIEQCVASTASEKVDPDWIEAMAFAWLARQTLQNEPGNLAEVTGAHHPVTLGGIYQA